MFSTETRKDIAESNIYAVSIETVTSKGATHTTTSDFSLLLPSGIAKAGQMVRPEENAERVFSVQSEAACEFLCGNWPTLKRKIMSSPGGEYRRLTLEEPTTSA